MKLLLFFKIDEYFFEVFSFVGRGIMTTVLWILYELQLQIVSNAQILKKLLPRKGQKNLIIFFEKLSTRALHGYIEFSWMIHNPGDFYQPEGPVFLR